MPTTDGAGVHLRRVIGQPLLRNFDPFLMLDHFHSDDPNAYIRGFPNHPHRGFETITLMRAGQMRHWDSKGNRGLIVGGGSQWMTAGRGIIHSEMPEQSEGLMSGFQLWLNLPAREKMRAFSYQDLEPERIATAPIGRDGALHLVAGQVDGLMGPMQDERDTEPFVATAVFEDDRPLDLEFPEHHSAFVFVSQGELEVGADAELVGEGRIALLGPGKRLQIRAPAQRSEAVIAAAKPLHEPIVQRGPFVMNTEAEIHQAFADYRAGRLDR